MTESLLLTAAGAALGAWLAQALSQFLVASLSTSADPIFLRLAPDWRVLGFTAGVAVLTCFLFGLAPAVLATRAGPGAALKSGGRGVTAGRERFSLRRALVVAQVARALVLVAVGVGLGLPLVFAVTRLASTFLYGLTPTDPLSLLLAALSLLAVALAAGYLPSRRAARLDPMAALRCE